MARGGARPRSGPQPDPKSERSERRGLSFAALPAEGFKGKAPSFPLPRRECFFVGADKLRLPDPEETERVAAREAELWQWAWTTPQACAWAMPSEAWRLHTIAMWVRTYVLCEGAEATAADKGSLHRFADQIGLTPDGLKLNGWAVAVDEVAARSATKRAPAKKAAPARRLRAVGDKP